MAAAIEAQPIPNCTVCHEYFSVPGTEKCSWCLLGKSKGDVIASQQKQRDDAWALIRGCPYLRQVNINKNVVANMVRERFNPSQVFEKLFLLGVGPDPEHQTLPYLTLETADMLYNELSTISPDIDYKYVHAIYSMVGEYWNIKGRGVAECYYAGPAPRTIEEYLQHVKSRYDQAIELSK